MISDSGQQERPVEMTHMHLACTPGHAHMILMLADVEFTNIMAASALVSAQRLTSDTTDIVRRRSPSSVHVERRACHS